MYRGGRRTFVPAALKPGVCDTPLKLPEAEPMQVLWEKALPLVSLLEKTEVVAVA